LYKSAQLHSYSGSAGTCGGLILGGCQTLTQSLYFSPSSTGRGRKTRWKSMWL